MSERAPSLPLCFQGRGICKPGARNNPPKHVRTQGASYWARQGSRHRAIIPARPCTRDAAQLKAALRTLAAEFVRTAPPEVGRDLPDFAVELGKSCAVC